MEDCQPSHSPPVGAVSAWPRSVQAVLVAVLAVGLIGLVASAVVPGTQPIEKQESVGRIDLNQATVAELQLLPGIGPSLAQRIDDYRQAHGPFQTVADVRKVPGVGPALLERIRSRATVTPAQVRQETRPSLVQPSATKLSKAQQLTGPINVNTADAGELQKLPGIGPKLSQRIVETRAVRPFQSVQDLRRVPGIGPKTVEKLKPFVKV